MSAVRSELRRNAQNAPARAPETPLPPQATWSLMAPDLPTSRRYVRGAPTLRAIHHPEPHDELTGGPGRPEDREPLRVGLFRAERWYLPDRGFPGAPDRPEPPNDLVPPEAWEGIMGLPTDVLLRTTDHLGNIVDHLHDQWSGWVDSMPETPSHSPFMFGPALDATDEFQAAPFAAMHGWYRQATAGLRNALETMVCGAAFAVRNDTSRYTEWRAGAYEPRFGNAVESLATDPQLAARERRLGGAGLFGGNPDGIVRETYGRLCRYAHGRPAHTNYDTWRRNGPVFVWNAFRQFWMDYCDAIALCHVLLKIGWADLVLPEVSRPLFSWASERWSGIGEAVEAEFFPDP